jgi:hypothetical protein
VEGCTRVIPNTREVARAESKHRDSLQYFTVNVGTASEEK